MKKEQQKLLKMLQEQKITDNDYQLLSEALNKESLCTQLENSWLVNPFQKIAGYEALCIGLVILIEMSIAGAYANIYFDGIFGFIMADNIKAIKPNFFLLVYQNSIAIFFLASLFLVSALILKQKRIRAIDFFGTVAMSRFPLLFWLLYLMLERYLVPETPWDYSKAIELHFSLKATIESFVMLGTFAWQIMTSFFAYKESSGIAGKSLWISFIAIILIGEVMAIPLSRWFLYS